MCNEHFLELAEKAITELKRSSSMPVIEVCAIQSIACSLVVIARAMTEKNSPAQITNPDLIHNADNAINQMISAQGNISIHRAAIEAIVNALCAIAHMVNGELFDPPTPIT